MAYGVTEGKRLARNYIEGEWNEQDESCESL